MYKSIYKEFKYYSIKPSLHRIAVFEYLHTHFTHPTVDEIYSGLNKKIPTLSKATIYNTLKIFESKGMIKVLTINKDYQRFEINLHPHGHFLCEQCGQVFDFNIEEFSLPTSLHPDTLKINDIQLYVRGICKECNHI